MADYNIASIFPQYYQSLESGLRGELPEDVLGLLSQQAAERGVASGMPGSQAAGYAGLRNLRDVMLQRITGAEQQIGGIEQQRQRAIQQQNLANWQRQNELNDRQYWGIGLPQGTQRTGNAMQGGILNQYAPVARYSTNIDWSKPSYGYTRTGPGGSPIMGSENLYGW